MNFTELFLIAIGLSMDAFAVSVCKGLSMPRLNIKQASVIAIFFGGFQAFMPAVGWLLGKQFEHYITSFDHWIAFILLAFIGGKMVYEAFANKDNENPCELVTLDMKEMLLLSVATSIDALAVGITFAFLQVSILPSVTLIGCTTFLLAFGGVIIGNKFGDKFQSKAEIAGGSILILIGLKILVEHLGII